MPAHVDELDDDVVDSLMQTAHDTSEEHTDRFPHAKYLSRRALNLG